MSSANSSPLPPFSVKGVRLSFLRDYILKCGGRLAVASKTTTDICIEFLMPSTALSQLSLVDQLVRDDPATSVVADATWFISHAWKYKFVDVVDAISSYFANSDTPDPVIWFDLFCNSQHGTVDRPFEWWVGTFTNAIATMGNVLMIMTPWDNPIPLTRAWCVFELYACASTNSRFQVSMPPAESERFYRGISETPELYYEMLSRVDSSTSEAFIPADRDRIHDAIRQTVGFVALDSLMFRVMETWIEEMITKQLENARESGDEVKLAMWEATLGYVYMQQQKFNQAETLFQNCVDRMKVAVGEDHEETLAIMNNLANLYAAQRRVDEAEQLFNDCLTKARARYGENHSEYFSALGGLGLLYSEQRYYDKAEPLIMQCYEHMRQFYGEDDPETISALNNLAGVYDDLGDAEKAEKLYTQCLEIRRKVFGSYHPDTLLQVNNLAYVHMKNNNYEQAVTMYVQALEGTCRVLGEEHPTYLKYLHNLGFCHQSHGNYSAAEPLLVFCLDYQRRILGDNHPDTLTTMHNTAYCFHYLNRFEDAVALHSEALERRRKEFGDDDEDTLFSMHGLAWTYQHMNRYFEARELYQDCLERREKMFGKEHPDTVKVAGDLRNLQALMVAA